MLVGAYAAAHVATMSATALGLFEDLLETGDPTLQVWLLAPTMPQDVTPEFDVLVREIRVFHGLAGEAAQTGDPMHSSPEN